MRKPAEIDWEQYISGAPWLDVPMGKSNFYHHFAGAYMRAREVWIHDPETGPRIFATIPIVGEFSHRICERDVLRFHREDLDQTKRYQVVDVKTVVLDSDLYPDTLESSWSLPVYKSPGVKERALRVVLPPVRLVVLENTSELTGLFFGHGVQCELNITPLCFSEAMTTLEVAGLGDLPRGLVLHSRIDHQHTIQGLTVHTQIAADEWDSFWSEPLSPEPGDRYLVLPPIDQDGSLIDPNVSEALLIGYNTASAKRFGLGKGTVPF